MLTKNKRNFIRNQVNQLKTPRSKYKQFTSHFGTAVPYHLWKAAYNNLIKETTTDLDYDFKFLITSIKSRKHCAVCDTRNPILLDFHHLDPTTKNFNISSQPKRPLPELLTEIQKCVVLCANCHRLTHNDPDFNLTDHL